MISKGRASSAEQRAQRGSKHPRAKLTEEDVVEIRRLAAEAAPPHRDLETGKMVGAYPAIARQYGVTKESIHHIVTRISWRHI